MKASRAIAAAATLVVAAAAAVILTSCGEKSTERLDALKADPLARTVPAGARLAKERLTPGGTTLGKPSPAVINRWFVMPEGDVKRAFDELVEAAQAAGWQPETAPGGGAVVGHKQLAGGSASIVISLPAEGQYLPPEVSPPAISVRLDG